MMVSSMLLAAAMKRFITLRTECLWSKKSLLICIMMDLRVDSGKTGNFTTPQVLTTKKLPAGDLNKSRMQENQFQCDPKGSQ
uniref:Uncharacterized protein n=1 Tax=Anguilla anguilla TaxID=7936 RepID=A0A0E9P601_ANGAN